MELPSLAKTKCLDGILIRLQAGYYNNLPFPPTTIKGALTPHFSMAIRHIIAIIRHFWRLWGIALNNRPVQAAQHMAANYKQSLPSVIVSILGWNYHSWTENPWWALIVSSSPPLDTLWELGRKERSFDSRNYSEEIGA